MSNLRGGINQAMVLEPRVSTFDPDLDLPSSRGSLRPGSPPDSPKRLIVNPLLFVLDWLAAVALIRHGIAHRNFAIFFVGALLSLLSFFLIRYYCLNCGGTGWLVWQRRHCCPIPATQVPGGRLRWLCVPRIGVQIVAWIYVLATTVILMLILRKA
jgi:hypothetical protein